MRKAILAATLLLASAGAASAADNGIYLGGSVGKSKVEINDFAGVSDIDFDADDTGFKFIAGIRPLDWLAVEASYVNLGEADEGILKAEADGISAFAVGFLPAGPVDLFAKAGLISFETTVDAEGFGEVFADDGTDLAYGVGVQFRVWSFSVRAEYEVFDVEDVDDLNMISVGATFTFL